MSRRIVVTHADYRFLVAEQAQEVGAPLTAVLLEPVARNTTAAIASAALHAIDQFGEDVILHVLPSDHTVTVDNSYWASAALAAAAAQAGLLVTFGITPTGPETGYGYIEAGARSGDGTHAVARFVEKPNRDAAERMLAAGGYYWNSGMFMLGARAFLSECATLAPDIWNAAGEVVAKARADLDFIRLDEGSLAQSPAISVDYAIFDRTALASLVPVTFPWSDLGSWDAVWAALPKDAAENAARGPTTVANSTRSLVISDFAHVVIDGLDEIAVVANQDAVYVGRVPDAQQVGAIVRALKADPGTAVLAETHRTVYRPWGGYTSVFSGNRFQVKRLFVRPGRRLSLQKHHHRAEHWIVVSGTAEVTIDGAMHMLSENQSIYLPLGCVHRLANPGKILLEIIEVQTGSYLGEDDIIRIEDEYRTHL